MASGRAFAMTAMMASVIAGTHADASVWDAYGFGARATAMGNAHVAAGQDFTAVYYNPAGLAGAPHPEVGVGLGLVYPSLSIERDRPSDPDGPSDELPAPNLGAHLGLVIPLGGRIDDRLALGAGLYLPTIEVTRIDGVDPQRPHFYRYESLTDKLILAFGMAIEVHERVSLGAGVQFLGALDGNATVELDLLSQRFVRKGLQVAVEPTGAVTAGLLVTPTDDLRLGFSFRDALDLRYDITIAAIVQSVGALEVDIAGTSLYTPQQFTWGAAWDPMPSLTLTADLVWARWSIAPDPSSQLVVALDAAPLGFEELIVQTDTVDLGAEDTLSPRLGVEWRPEGAWTLRGGYGFRPTPLPAQTGPYNHIDSDAHQISAGVAWRVRNPLARERAPMQLEWSAQLNVVEGREMAKADPDDAVGDYRAGGVLWHSALTLRHNFY